MRTLVLEGGFPIWFVLIFSAFALFLSARYAALPSPGRLRLAGALGATTLLSTLTAVCADLAAIGHHGPKFIADHPSERPYAVLLQGLAEALSPAIIGFTALTLAALLVALGVHRAHSEA